MAVRCDKPRNASKIVSMATEIMAARQLTYYAAEKKIKDTDVIWK